MSTDRACFRPSSLFAISVVRVWELGEVLVYSFANCARWSAQDAGTPDLIGFGNNLIARLLETRNLSGG